MKIGWGKGIVAAIILFMMVTALMVVISLNTDFDLVTDNYYEKELKYQQVIDRMENAGMPGEQVKVNNLQSAIEFIFPGSVPVKGDVHFYRPSDAGKDFNVKVNEEINNHLLVGTEKMDKGLWKVKISWEKNGTEYYNEQNLMVY
jgi:hypothetical protein